MVGWRALSIGAPLVVAGLACGNSVILEGTGGAGGGAVGSVTSGKGGTTTNVTSSGVTSSNVTSSGVTSSGITSSSVASSSGFSSSSVASSSGITSVSVSASSSASGTSSVSVASSSVSGTSSVSSASGSSTGSSMVPPGWACPPQFYAANDGCDCGCGAFDPDCADATSAPCQFCNDPGSCSPGGCPGSIDPMNNAVCVPAGPEVCGNGVDDDLDGATDCADSDCLGQPGCAPPAWKCPLPFYGTKDGCDCGCGAFDPDCTTTNVGSCQFCSDTGSCNVGQGCPGNISPTQNETCL